MSLPYYPMYPRDFFEGTQQMSLELKGAYIMVLNLMYTRGGPISDEPGYISRYVGCSVRKWKQVRDELVAMGKLVVQDGIISNSRADEVIEKQRSYQDKQTENRSRPNKNNAEETPPKTTRVKSESKPDTDIDDVEDSARPENELDVLEAKCRKWANGSLNLTLPSAHSLDPIIRLLKPTAGIPCAEADVERGITRAASWLHTKGRVVHSFSYFEKAIIEARDERLRPNPEPEAPHERAGQSQSERNANGRGGHRQGAGGKHGASPFGAAWDGLFGGDQEATDVSFEPINGRNERVA